jgi:hypothetical protein
MPIGFELDEEEDESEPEPEVGTGHASYTPDDVANYGAMLELAYRAARRLRKLGATRLKVGDIKVEFGPAPRARKR